MRFSYMYYLIYLEGKIKETTLYYLLHSDNLRLHCGFSDGKFMRRSRAKLKTQPRKITKIHFSFTKSLPSPEERGRELLENHVGENNNHIAWDFLKTLSRRLHELNNGGGETLSFRKSISKAASAQVLSRLLDHFS